jgi:hypothetical protein
MKNLSFCCPHCGESYKVSEVLLGRTINCPACSAEIQVPHPEPPRVRPCPFCGEEILTVAIKCKHCGSDLRSHQRSPSRKREMIGIVALLLPLCTVALSVVWVLNRPLLYDPTPSLYWIAIGTVLLTAVLIAAEADMLGAGTESDRTLKGRRQEGPLTWFFFVCVLWIAAFPIWMRRRSMYGLKSRCLVAVCVAVVFTAGLLAIPVVSDSVAEEKDRLTQEIRQDLEANTRDNPDYRGLSVKGVVLEQDSATTLRGQVTYGSEVESFATESTSLVVTLCGGRRFAYTAEPPQRLIMKRELGRN